MNVMGTITGTAVAVMLTTGDLAPAARTMGTEALRQWAALHGVDELDTMYVIGVAYARGTVARDADDDFPLSGEWADEPTPQNVREIASALFGVDAWDADQSVDAWESGYYDERAGQWAEASTMVDVFDAVTSSREA